MESRCRLRMSEGGNENSGWGQTIRQGRYEYGGTNENGCTVEIVVSTPGVQEHRQPRRFGQLELLFEESLQRGEGDYNEFSRRVT